MTDTDKALRESLMLAGYPARLEKFFKRMTTFNIRWGKNLHKDKIAAGVYKDEFLTEFSRKELKQLVQAELVAEKRFRQHNGSLRAAIAYIHYEMPQVAPVKKAIEKASSPGWLPWFIRFWLIFIVVLVLVAIGFKRAHGFSSAPNTRDVGLEGTLPNVDARGYFDDKPMGVRCYWLKYSGVNVAISCVRL